MFIPRTLFWASPWPRRRFFRLPSYPLPQQILSPPTTTALKPLDTLVPTTSYLLRIASSQILSLSLPTLILMFQAPVRQMFIS